MRVRGSLDFRQRERDERVRQNLID